MGGGDRVVGDHDHRLAELVDRLAQQAQDVGARLRVEVAGRLVGEDDGRFGDQGAGDGDALLLAAGELGGPVGAAVLEADRADQLVDPLRRSGLRPAIESGSTRFSSAVRTGSRLKNWKTKPSLSRRSLVSSPSSRSVISTAVELDRARGRLVEAGEDVHQGRLARARGAHDRGEAVALEAGADPGERVDGGVALAVAAGRARWRPRPVRS